jgi:hypothetical protein
MSLAAASKHIKALEVAGLIRREIQGRIHVCHLNAGPLSAADEWLRYYERFWDSRLDRLEDLLRRDGPAAGGSTAAPTSREAPVTSPPKRSKR